MWTKDRILNMLQTNDLAVERAIVALYDRQTQDEKHDSATKHDNQRGFRSNHASTGSYYARIILKGWKQDGNKKNVHLNPIKLAKARKIVLQYSRQLTEQAQLNEAKEETRVPRSRMEPPAGSYAATARAMAEIMPGHDWDAWKDQMKDGLD